MSSAEVDVEALKTRVAAMEKEIWNLTSYVRVAVVVAAIFGIGGAFGFNAITKVKDTIDTVAKSANDLTASVATADKKYESIKKQISPEDIAKRTSDALKAAAPGVVRDAARSATRDAMPKAFKVELGTGICGLSGSIMKCFVDTGSEALPIATVASQSGSFPRPYNLECEPGKRRGHSGLIVTVYYTINLGLGNKFYVTILQPGRTNDHPLVYPPV